MIALENREIRANSPPVETLLVLHLPLDGRTGSHRSPSG
jgi:hypothetical protein